jgi:hypothetical protein
MRVRHVDDWYYRSLAGVFERRLDNSALVTTLTYEIANMWDFGIPTDAMPL